MSSPPRCSMTALLFSLDSSLVSRDCLVSCMFRSDLATGVAMVQLTWVGKVGLVPTNRGHDALLALGQLLHVVRQDRLCAGGIHFVLVGGVLVEDVLVGAVLGCG